MKRILTIAALIVIAFSVYLWYSGRSDTSNPSDAPRAGYQNYIETDPPLSFEYRLDPDGYILQEIDSGENADGLIKTILLMLKSDYQSLISGEREGGEGPPAITIQVYSNTKDLSPREWAEENPGLSSFPLIRGEIRDTSIAGEDAISYEADGLYATRNAVIRKSSLIYYVSGSYIDRDSPLYRDYDSILESLEL